MRYFKCDTQVDNEDLKATHGVLVQKKDNMNRRDKVRERIGLVVLCVVFLTLFIASQWLISFATDKVLDVFGDETLLLGLMSVLLCIVFVASAEGLALALSLVLGALIAVFLWGPRDQEVRKEDKRLREETLRRACQHLRQFYGFQEPSVVTKCYDSSDKRFKDHDICLFMADGELRLTTNLQHGFLDMRRDLGCYAFLPEEIQLSDSRAGERQAVELRAGEVTFLLGQRAKAFVEQNLI